MSRYLKVQHFDSEGRQNLPHVLKNVKNYFRVSLASGAPYPKKLVIFTRQGEGPMLAYNQLGGLDVSIIAVTFPAHFTVRLADGSLHSPEMPEKVRKFFDGVEIPVVRGRLPFDDIAGAVSHNQEMGTFRNILSIFGGSMPLIVQSVMQAADEGLVSLGEEVVAMTADTAAVVKASTSRLFLSKTCGLVVSEVICKPRNLTITRPAPVPEKRQIAAVAADLQITRQKNDLKDGGPGDKPTE